MTIDIEIIGGLITGLFLTLIGLMLGIRMLARALNQASEANQKLSTANTALSDVNIRLNDELQESAKERKEWSEERESLKREFEQFRLDTQKVIDQLGGEIIKLKGKSTTQEKEIGVLKNLIEEKDALIKILTERIDDLTTSLGEREQSIGVLEKALVRAEKQRIQLETDLRAVLAGKVDRTPQDEPGESISETNKPEEA